MAAEPTVPKVILEPLTVPVRFSVPDVERSMVPLKVDPVCCQLSLKVPVKAPPYLPDQLPDRSTAAGGALEVGGAAVELAVVETLAAAGGVEVVVDLAPLLLHPVAKSAKAP